MTFPNLSRSGSGCQVVPRVGVIDPVLEWSWTSSAVDSDFLNVIMTPAIIDLNEDGIPDVIFGSTNATGGSLTGQIGVIRALSGRDGAEIFTITDANMRINALTSVAVGDIDLDGHPEIVACDSSSYMLIVFEHNGTFKWRSPRLETGAWGAPAIADIDSDGIPEIVIGKQVLNNDGSIRWTGAGGRGGIGWGALSLVADINLDGSPDVVAGNTVYNADGSIQVQFSPGDGVNAVANFDDDAFPEIVLVSLGYVYLLEHDGSITWGPVNIPGGGYGGPPTIADYDNDGEVEIGVAGATRYVVFETDGSIKWQTEVRDISSTVTGSSVFDFDGDGSAEVVYRDELNLRIYRGTDGVTLFETPMSSGTFYEYVVVADVDADGNAEIVSVANNHLGYGPQRGVFVYGSASDSWVTTRKIWNQHTYHITNVNDDGTIPAREKNNWETYNNYRQNILPDTSGPGLYDAPDLIPSYVQVSEGSSDFTITARIGNAGVVTVGPGVSVAFYDGDPKSGGTLLGTTKTTTYIDPGTYEDVSFTVSAAVIQNLFVSADDDGTLTGSVSECNELNNIYDRGKGVIVPSNRPPEITSEAVVYATKGVAYTYDVEATDADEGDVLTYSLVQSPSGLVIDASSGLIQWTPMEDQVGCTEVLVTVVDSHGASDTQDYSLYVTNALINQEKPLTINLERIPTTFNRPIGIAHQDPTNSLVISLNYPYGIPYSFEQIFEDGTHQQFSTVANLIDEIKITTVRSGNLGGFNTGDLFAGNGRDGEIIRISSDGNTIDNPWVSLPGSDNGLPWGLYVDRTGIYGGDLIVVTTGGEVWRIDSEKNPTQLADVIAYNVNRGGLIGDDYRHNFEAVITLPDDPQYGPWAGKIVAGVNYNNGRIYAFDNSGYVGEWNLGLPDTERLVEDLDLIPENENFYIVEYSGNSIYGVPSSAFDQVAGKILLTQEFHGTSGLFVVSWDPTVESFVKEELKAILNGRDFYGHWEHATFSTAGIPGILPACRSETKTVSLLTEQNVEVGTVTLSANGDNLTVAIASNNGWLLSETDVSAKDNATDIPRTAEGRPDRENFELRNTYDPKVVKNEYQISFSGVDANGDKNIVIAVHARVQMLEHCEVVKDESAWADGERFTENSWETYTNYQFQCIENTPPEITSEAVTNATRDVQYHYDVEATDADGDVLTYSLVTFPENMIINAATGLIEWVPNGDQVGNHEVTVQVEDGKGGSDSQTFTITVSGGTTTDLTVTMHANPASIIVGGSSMLTWTSTNASSAEINQGIGGVDVNGSREVSPTETTTYTITVTGDDGTASASATVVVNSTVTVPDVIGMTQAEAEATIAAAGLVVGNVTETSTTDVPKGRVFNQNPRGGSVVSAHDAVDISVSLGIITTDPVVTLISPEPHADIKSPTDINASITDPDPLDLTWETRFAPVGTEDFRVIGSGAGTMDAAPVGRFDPTLLANDTYLVKINWKKGPRTGGIFFYYSVSGNLKVGNFRLEFVDLQIPLAGIPITIKRVYDTLDLRKGDFGAGWTLGYPGVVRDSAPAGTAFSLRSRVYVTMPDGRRIGFQFAPVQVSPFFPFIFKTAFKPDPGVYDTLSVDEDYVMHSAGYFYEGFFSENFNPSRYTLTTKDGTKYVLDEQNGLLGVEDLNGNILTVNETGITHSSGTKIAFVRDTEDRITEIVDPDGNAIHYSYDAIGNLTEKTDQEGLRTQFTYYDTPAHFLREIFDPLGRMAQRTEYDEHGRVIAVYDALGNRVEQDYDPNNFLTTQTDGNGNVSEYLYDQNGNVLEIRSPLGGVRKFAYDDPNNPYRETRITDENGNATSCTYDTQGNMLTKTDAEDNMTTVTYGNFGNITSVEDPLGRLATFRYDTAGNLTELINPLGLSRKFTRDTQGRITADVDFNGNVATFDYTDGCSCGLPGKITYPDGAVRTLEYNRFGQTIRIVDETGAETLFVYDHLGRKISETDHEGNKNISTYNAHLLVSQTDPLNRTTTFEYDGADNLIKQTDALDGVTQFTYDANGNRTSVTDPVNNRTEFVYDELNRLVKRIDPLGNTTTYAYDTVGNRTEQVDRNGRKTTFGYDQLNHLTREDWYAGDSVIRSILITYDEAGNQLSVSDADSAYAFTYDTLNRVEEVDNHGTTGIPRIILAYQYDNNGNLISTEDNLGTRVEAAYNSRNFQTRRTWSGNSINPARVDYTYNRRGDRTRVDKYRDLNGNLSAGFSTFGVNPVGLVSNITHFTSTSSSIVEYTYGYDAARQLINESHHGQTSSYAYDMTGQLIGASHSVFDDESYRYDANGNRTSSHRHGTGYVAGTNNQLLSDGDFDYVYDNEGNLVLKTARSTGNITSYTYDHRNRLTNVVEKASGGTVITQVEFGYDVLNRRIKKSVDGDTMYTAYNLENAWADFDAGGQVIANYFFGDRIDENIARYRPGDGLSWYQTDKLGTIRDLSGSNGDISSHVDYDSFGNVLGVTDSTAIDRFLFTGREFDEEIGLYYYRARQYDSNVGRFVSLDPIEFNANDTNLYRYLENSSLGGIDPSGLGPIMDMGIKLKNITLRTVNSIKCMGQLAFIAFGEVGIEFLLSALISTHPVIKMPPKPIPITQSQMKILLEAIEELTKLEATAKGFGAGRVCRGGKGGPDPYKFLRRIHDAKTKLTLKLWR